MDRVQSRIEVLRVWARSNDPNRAAFMSLSLERLCDAIEREEAAKRRGEDWSIARDYVRSRLCGRDCYSIKSSARDSSDCGTGRPCALAVLRLMTSSYFVGA